MSDADKPLDFTFGNGPSKSADAFSTQFDMNVETGNPDPLPERTEIDAMEEVAEQIVREMPATPTSFEEMWVHVKRLMASAWVQKNSLQRLRRDFERALAALRSDASKIETRVAHTEKQLEGVQSQLFDLRSGVQKVISISANEANASRIERRYNGQLYQRLEDRLFEDAKQRELIVAYDRLRMYAGWAIFAGIMVLIFVILGTKWS